VTFFGISDAFAEMEIVRKSIQTATNYDLLHSITWFAYGHYSPTCLQSTPIGLQLVLTRRIRVLKKF